MNRYHILIPARLDSSRLPRKALAEVGGRALILHTLARAHASAAISVHVATDSEAIAALVRADGGEVVMTAREHASGTDRLAEAVDILGLASDAVVVNLQGDEPAMPAACLDQVAGLLAADPAAQMATLWERLHDPGQWQDPNVVKLVADHGGRALYFSRAPIPFARSGSWLLDAACRHVGLYAYRVAALRAWRHLPPSQAEQLESLEQLRALSSGWTIRVAEACAPIPVGIDTAEDLARFRAAIGEQA